MPGLAEMWVLLARGIRARPAGPPQGRSSVDVSTETRCQFWYQLKSDWTLSAIIGVICSSGYVVGGVASGGYSPRWARSTLCRRARRVLIGVPIRDHTQPFGDRSLGPRTPSSVEWLALSRQPGIPRTT